MRILFCNVAFRGRSGTETFLGDLVPAMRERGHEVACLTTPTYPVDTGVGAALRARGIVVVQAPGDVPWRPDVVHGHHREPTRLAIDAWPDVPVVFVVHDARAPTDEPLRDASVVRWVAVDDLCAARLHDVPPDRRSIVPNAVDLERFVQRESVPDRPRSPLLFMGHAPDHAFVEVLERACEARGTELGRLTLGGEAVEAPEEHLGAFDLAFARGRSALEAMASGLGVICCGYEGLGPLVTPDVFEEARRFNFGRGLLVDPHDVEGVLARWDAWDAAAVGAVTERVRDECTLPRMVDAWEALYREILAEASVSGAVLGAGRGGGLVERREPEGLRCVGGDAEGFRTRMDVGCRGRRGVWTPRRTEDGAFRCVLGEEAAAQGWYGAERIRDGVTFRWSGPATQAAMPLDAALDRPWRVRARVLWAMEGVEPSTIELVEGGRRLSTSRRPEASGGWTLEASVAPAGPARPLDLALRVERTVRPVDLGVSADERALGCAVAWVELEPRA